MYQSGGRWWENYAVRYFMPSVAGSAIVLWLSSVDTTGLGKTILLPPEGGSLDTADLVLLFLYGNLFCYVASYPVLGFHATRALDFGSDGEPTSLLVNAYVWTMVLCLAAFLIAWGAHQGQSNIPCFLLAGVFALYQVLRISTAMRRVKAELHDRENYRSMTYDFGERLAKKRTGCSNDSLMVERWRDDYVETYRHLREHGNSAFIFFLELVLASLIYSIVASSESEFQDLMPDIGILLALWCVPAVFVHWVGQQLEREYLELS